MEEVEPVENVLFSEFEDEMIRSEDDTELLHTLTQEFSRVDAGEASCVCSISIEEATIPQASLTPFELKKLPDHLKYIFLGNMDQKPVIISNRLEADKEEKLTKVLKHNSNAIAWTLQEIQGLSQRIVQHRIALEEKAKLVRQP